jgi:hypothetical protein
METRQLVDAAVCQCGQQSTQRLATVPHIQVLARRLAILTGFLVPFISFSKQTPVSTLN